MSSRDAQNPKAKQGSGKGGAAGKQSRSKDGTSGKIGLALFICAFLALFFAATAVPGQSETGKRASTTKHAATTAATTKSATTAATTAATTSTASTTAATTSATTAQASTTSAPAVTLRLPKVGMSAGSIDATELGPHDEVGETIDSGKYKGGVSYYWHSKNGKGDMVFSAIVLNGKVAAVNKFNTSLNYWADGTFSGRDFPDLYASGEKVEKKTTAPKLEDPLDYSNGEEYADNAYKYFEYMGSSNPWQDALEYWDQNGP